MSYDDLSDEEMVEMILESLQEDERVRTDYLRVECVDGKPILSGRVGSDEELQTIDEVLTDVLEFDHYENNVWVDDTLAFEGADEEDEGRLNSVDDDEDDLETEEGFEEEEEE